MEKGKLIVLSERKKSKEEEVMAIKDEDDIFYHIEIYNIERLKEFCDI